MIIELSSYEINFKIFSFYNMTDENIDHEEPKEEIW